MPRPQQAEEQSPLVTVETAALNDVSVKLAQRCISSEIADPVEVQVAICVKRIFSVKNEEQTFGVAFELTMMWKMQHSEQKTFIDEKKVVGAIYSPEWEPIYRLVTEPNTHGSRE